MNPSRFGDLVRIKPIGAPHEYYGIVTTAQGDDLMVFFGNGLYIKVSIADVEFVPLHEGNPCPANFAEILRDRREL